MSGNSNLGYGNTFPNSGTNGQYVNAGSSNNSMFFTSTQIPGLPGLIGAQNNVDAAAGIIKGGSKYLKRKIKNITKKYKMNKKSLKRKASTLRRKIRKRATKTKSRRYRQRGGYSQYQNNLPLTPNYSTGGHLNPSNSALANPVPYKVLSAGGNCTDNYNHYTGQGFASRGH
jgi:hypothetical protein